MTYVYEDEIDSYLAMGYPMEQLHVLQYGVQKPQEPEFNQDVWEHSMRINEIRKIVRKVIREVYNSKAPSDFNVDKSMAKDTLYVLIPERDFEFEKEVKKFLDNATEESYQKNIDFLSGLGVMKYEYGFYSPFSTDNKGYALYPINLYKKIGADILLSAEEKFGDKIKIVDWGTYSRMLNFGGLKEAVTFDNNKSFIPPPNVAQRAQEALNVVSSNNLTQSGTDIGSGLSKAKELASKQTQSFDQMRKIKSFFDTQEEAYRAEKSAGKTVRDSGLIQSWELRGGDSGRDWVNQQMNSLNQSNLNTKKNLRQAGGAGTNKGMGIFDTKMMSTNNHRIHR